MYERRTIKKGVRTCLKLGISDAEILALPPQPGDEEPDPPPYESPEERRQLGDFAAQWATVGANEEFSLHPDTEPGAIRAAQRAVVAEARARLGPAATAAEIGEDVCLPAWSVEQRLGELDAGDAT